MKKSSLHEAVLVPLIEKNEVETVTDYLLEHSNLPGRMANLPLISTMADYFGKNPLRAQTWSKTFEKWFNTPIDGNSAETILVLAALESFGAIYLTCEKKEQVSIEKKLLASLNDPRWRVREIVTESYKRIGLTSYSCLRTLFDLILADQPTPLEIRGVLATVAHPELLVSTEQLAFSQKIMALSFNYYLNFDGATFTKEDKLVLKKGLAFAPSVIVCKNPTAGFPFFENLIRDKNNKEINSLIKENLKKKRLEKVYPTEVETLLSLLNK